MPNNKKYLMSFFLLVILVLGILYVVFSHERSESDGPEPNVSLAEFDDEAEPEKSIVQEEIEPLTVPEVTSGQKDDELEILETQIQWEGNNQPETPETDDQVVEDIDILQKLKEKALKGSYGTMPIEDVLREFRNIPGGPEIQEILRALAARKQEALPLVKEGLQTGDWYEKHLLTKLLRYSPWPETFIDLLDLAQSKEDHWLAREGALYALGALANQDAGPAVVSLLYDPESPPSVQLVSLATLGRIGYVEAIPDIQQFLDHEDLQIRFFANYALAELNAPVDADFLLSLLEHDDRVVRQEATGALWFVEGDDITDILQELKENDPYAAIRASAGQALIRREIQELDQREKLHVLSKHLAEADQASTITFILQTILKECGPEGQAYVESLTVREDFIGDRAGTFLLWKVTP